MAGNDSANCLTRGWKYLISNHSHDANGGCAPDCVCKDMEYRCRKARDIAEIVSDGAMVEIAKNLSLAGQDQNIVQLVAYNTLPYSRDVIVPLDIEVPEELGKGIAIDDVVLQPVLSEKSSIFVDSMRSETRGNMFRRSATGNIQALEPMRKFTFPKAVCLREVLSAKLILKFRKAAKRRRVIFTQSFRLTLHILLMNMRIT